MASGVLPTRKLEDYARFTWPVEAFRCGSRSPNADVVLGGDRAGQKFRRGNAGKTRPSSGRIEITYQVVATIQCDQWHLGDNLSAARFGRLIS